MASKQNKTKQTLVRESGELRPVGWACHPISRSPFTHLKNMEGVYLGASVS